MSSSPHHDDSSSLPMPTRLFSSLKRPFSRPKNDHDRYPSLSSERTHAPIHREAPPNYHQIAMGLHLSRTPHFPAHLAHLFPPAPQPRLHRSVSPPPRTRPNSLCPPSTTTTSRSHSPAYTHPPRSPSRLAPPPPRSALKKPRVKGKASTTVSSSVTPDTASASSTVASSVLPQTPTRSLARSSGGLLARFLGKERGRTLVVLPVERERERKAVRFGGLKEEDES